MTITMWIYTQTVLKHVRWFSVLVLIGTVIGGLHDTEAMLFEVENSEPNVKLYLRILYVDEGYVLVGARDYLYNISTQTMTVGEATTHEWKAMDDEILYCSGDSERFGRDCQSYVRSAVKKNDSLFHICASSSKKPQCRELRLENGRWVLTEVLVTNELVDSLAPILPWNEVLMLETTDTNTIYAASHILKSGSVWQPNFFRGNSESLTGEMVSGLRSGFSAELFNIDYITEKATEFTSIFETQDYVFLTYTEPAMESIYGVGTESATYSRIARVCKNDKGRGFDQDKSDKYLFATLFKTRLMCGNSGITLSKASGKYLERKFLGYYGLYINEIADSSVPHISSVTGADGEEIILAIFNSPSSSARTSAICAYKVSELNRVLDTSDQIEFDDQQVPRIKKTSRPFAKCYEDSTNQTRETRAAMNNYLLSTPVYPINNNSLFLSGVDYKMTRMVVDWQVEAIDGKKYDMIYVSTDDGRLLKLVKYDSEEKYHVVEERDIFPGQAIQEMKLIHEIGGKKHLLVNSLQKMKRVALEKCHHYTSGPDCVAQRDPLCSWSPMYSKCVSTTHEAHDKYQNISSGHCSVCKAKEEETVGPISVELTTVGDSGKKSDTGAVKDPKEEKPMVAGTNNTVLIVLVAILPIVCACFAFFAGYMYSKKRFISPTPHIDHELSNKCKDDTLNSNCDAYQTIPKQTNLQMMHNFNGKSPNVDTVSVGERTLKKQKQIYV